MSRAHFRSQVDLEDWDSSFDRGISKQKLKDLGSLGFFINQQNPLSVEKQVRTKLTWLSRYCRRLCQEGHSVTFLPVNIFFEEVQVARASGKYFGYLRRLRLTQVLISDDFGLRNYTHEEANTLVDLLEERTFKGPVVITSQVDLKGWTKLFEDPVIAEAVVDRLQHPAQKVILAGGSYRKRLSKKNGSVEIQK